LRPFPFRWKIFYWRWLYKRKFPQASPHDAPEKIGFFRYRQAKEKQHGNTRNAGDNGLGEDGVSCGRNRCGTVLGYLVCGFGAEREAGLDVYLNEANGPERQGERDAFHPWSHREHPNGPSVVPRYADNRCSRVRSARPVAEHFSVTATDLRKRIRKRNRERASLPIVARRAATK
jgi:hypothetical protein